ERIKDAQLIQKVNATALGFLLPIRFIDFSFPTSRNQKNKNNDSIMASVDKCYQESLSHGKTINDIAAGSADISHTLDGLRKE
ncbi:hypothetical protein KU735_23295, partial [Salmonella enterica subsp. enterica serovar Give]|nr:hypothetical protein [Salmonella enterica subsp. enterica serovar Give]